MARADKVAEAIRQEASLVIHDQLKDPRIGFVTVTKVEITPDMRHAKVFYSVLGGDLEYKKTQEALDSGLGLIRKLISERINLKFAPEVIFRPDRSAEFSVRIQEVLDQVKHDDESRKEKPKDEPKKTRRSIKKKK